VAEPESSPPELLPAPPSSYAGEPPQPNGRLQGVWAPQAVIYDTMNYQNKLFSTNSKLKRKYVKVNFITSSWNVDAKIIYVVGVWF
jgi:predicted peptidase